MREVGPHVVHEGSGAGALAMTPIVFRLVGTEWEPHADGTPGGFQDLVGSDYELSTAATSHDGVALIVNGEALSA